MGPFFSPFLFLSSQPTVSSCIIAYIIYIYIIYIPTWQECTSQPNCLFLHHRIYYIHIYYMYLHGRSAQVNPTVSSCIITYIISYILYIYLHGRSAQVNPTVSSCIIAYIIYIYIICTYMAEVHKSTQLLVLASSHILYTYILYVPTWQECTSQPNCLFLHHRIYYIIYIICTYMAEVHKSTQLLVLASSHILYTYILYIYLHGRSAQVNPTVCSCIIAYIISYILYIPTWQECTSQPNCLFLHHRIYYIHIYYMYLHGRSAQVNPTVCSCIIAYIIYIYIIYTYMAGVH